MEDDDKKSGIKKAGGYVRIDEQGIKRELWQRKPKKRKREPKQPPVALWSPPSDAPLSGTYQPRIPHPFHYLAKRATDDDTYLLGKRGVGRKEVLHRHELHSTICTYIEQLGREKCCVNVRNKTVKCNCLRMLQNKHPTIISAIAAELLDGFDMSETRHTAFLVREYRYAAKAVDPKWGTKYGPQRRFLLPVFVDDFDSNDPNCNTTKNNGGSCTNENNNDKKLSEDDDGEETARIRSELEETMNHSICECAWTTLHNIGEKALNTVRQRARGRKSFVHGNTGKYHGVVVGSNDDDDPNNREDGNSGDNASMMGAG